MGTILVLAGLPLVRWLDNAYSRWSNMTVSLVALVLSLVAWLLLVFLWDWLAIVRENADRRAILVGGGLESERNGWKLLISQTASGITAAIDLSNKQNGWPLDTRWELLNPFGEEKRAIIRTANLVNIAAQWPGFAQVTWPIDFWGESIESGSYSLCWVVDGKTTVRQTFQVKRERVKAEAAGQGLHT